METARVFYVLANSTWLQVPSPPRLLEGLQQKDDHDERALKVEERKDSWDVSATFGDAPRAGPDAEKGAAE